MHEPVMLHSLDSTAELLVWALQQWTTYAQLSLKWRSDLYQLTKLNNFWGLAPRYVPSIFSYFLSLFSAYCNLWVLITHITMMFSIYLTCSSHPKSQYAYTYRKYHIFIFHKTRVMISQNRYVSFNQFHSPQKGC